MKKLKDTKFLTIALFIIFLVMLFLVVTGFFFRVDNWVNESIASLRSPFFTSVMMFFTIIGDWYSMIILSLFLLISLYVLKRKKNALFFGVCMAFGYLLSELLKLIIQKARPESTLLFETGYSFPSQHATMSAIFFLVLMYSFKEDIKNKLLKNIFVTSCIFMFLAIGFSRIYLGVHYFSDVIAGFALGIFIVNFIMLSIFKKE